MERHGQVRWLILICGVALVFGVAEFWQPLLTRYISGASPEVAVPQRRVQRPITAAGAEPPSDGSSATATTSNQVPRSFGRRLRCTQYRQMFGNQLSPDVLSLLCDRKPLDAVKLLSSMAGAGDERARIGLALLGHVDGSCDALKPSPTFQRFAASMMTRAVENGATSQTQQRLSEALTEELAGPTADDLEACRQSAVEFRNLWPAMLEELASSLGRSIKTLRGENEVDVQIEYDRKVLVAGDAATEYRLANDLLRRGTTTSQTEAVALLREAAGTSPEAKTELATCLLRGCPDPAPDPTEARLLLAQAARAGNLAALILLSGTADAQASNLASILPVPEQYAWSQFRSRLNEEGCFGTSQYLAWVAFPGSGPNLMAMSPADSADAQSRAAELFASDLERTRETLGCN